MNWKQLIGLNCKHTHLSRPLTLDGVTERICTDCGYRKSFAGWQVDASERSQVAHHQVRGAIKRVGSGLLRFKRKESGK